MNPTERTSGVHAAPLRPSRAAPCPETFYEHKHGIRHGAVNTLPTLREDTGDAEAGHPVQEDDGA
ncbi:hypothetical protein ACFYNO_32615 [Kitasatospora sp. NPDC006697]|uniref:hypothetical protein n=1 Tax=Kitasatospora sp. NPDC006697 TaxID=3364020 RepID=UPI0036A9FCFA